jgi:two-component system, OmpR family, response regulator RstA
MITTRVLLVEDDKFLREIYIDTLTQSGFAVNSAEDGVSAEQKIREGAWDLLLLDIILPQTDGIEIMKKLRSDPSFTPQMQKPVIFLTNLDNENEVKQALELAKGYIIKSQINPGQLVGKINEILQEK